MARTPKRRRSDTPSPPPIPYEDTTDPADVTVPVTDSVHNNLVNAYKVQRKHQMCYIFDFIIPCRQWKRGTKYTEADPFALYGASPWDDLTETDEPKGRLQPYYPIEFVLKYKFVLDFWLDDFLEWGDGELFPISVGLAKRVKGKKTTRMHFKDTEIPLLYAQVIAQLLAEDRHGNYNTGHEALRRQSYARRVLDVAAREIRRYNGPSKDFRSQVLTPILQRYMQGVPDSYTPSLRAAVAGGDHAPTIADATEFYLGNDPIEESRMALYVRNLVYIPESRWYLGILMKTIDIRSAGDFNKVRTNHDTVMTILQEVVEDDGSERDDESDHSNEDYNEPFNEAEVWIIVNEGLEGFFKSALKSVAEFFEEAMAQRTPEDRERFAKAKELRIAERKGREERRRKAREEQRKAREEQRKAREEQRKGGKDDDEEEEEDDDEEKQEDDDEKKQEDDDEKKQEDDEEEEEEEEEDEE